MRVTTWTEYSLSIVLADDVLSGVSLADLMKGEPQVQELVGISPG
ncbi:MAG: hypothetical protein ABI637_06215 [Gemmatimonadota bacterium]